MTLNPRPQAQAPWVCRDVHSQDLPTLLPWLTPDMARSLPPARHRTPAAERWLLVASASGEPQACLRLRRAIGLQQARHWYHVGCVVHAAPELGLVHRLHTLQLGNDLTGASELADIAWPRSGPAALNPEQARAALHALLVAALQQLGGQRPPGLIVELPGLRDAQGRSPFWDGLGRHFYSSGDPASQTLGPAWREQVAALLPRQTVYTDFLSPEARAAVGQADPTAHVLLALLQHFGLRYNQHVRIDDGGPVFEGDAGLVFSHLPAPSA